MGGRGEKKSSIQQNIDNLYSVICAYPGISLDQLINLGYANRGLAGNQRALLLVIEGKVKRKGDRYYPNLPEYSNPQSLPPVVLPRIRSTVGDDAPRGERLCRCLDALRELEQEGLPFALVDVCTRAGVGTTYLYSSPVLLAEARSLQRRLKQRQEVAV